MVRPPIHNFKSPLLYILNDSFWEVDFSWAIYLANSKFIPSTSSGEIVTLLGSCHSVDFSATQILREINFGTV